MTFRYRKAYITDIDKLETLIEISAKSINSAYYSETEINAALGNAWAVDKQIIKDKTYWIVENLNGETIGCGGWSKRKQLFGRNDANTSSDEELIPKIHSARIRAFFVHPHYVRMGIGKALLQKCEKEAKSFGFDSLELVATLSGVQLYKANGYRSMKCYDVDLGQGVTNKVVSMHKNL